jgi:magnesium chelatase family protein
MLATIASCALHGIDAIPVDVEVGVSIGLPGFHVSGLGGAGSKESAVRIRAALQRVGHDLPQKKIAVNLAPSEVKKTAARFDLAIALGALIADGLYPPAALDGLLVLGELGLDGVLRPARGTLAAAMLARDRGLRGVLVPAASAAEARLVEELEVHVAGHLGEVIGMLAGERSLLAGPAPPPTSRRWRTTHDMADVRGQPLARAALEIAVAGGHNILLLGPPGIGKTMLASRVPGILPPMTLEESLEATRVHSAMGLAEQGLIVERPFRAPHHSITNAALIGGGHPIRPGEISLAHHGVLFLDELPEFNRGALESLRQPLEERRITIGRIHDTVRLPASFLLIASANPCPCGWAGSRVRECTCPPGAMGRYRSRLSGPLLDRIDLHVAVRPVALAQLRDGPAGEPTAPIRARVHAARERQRRRLAPLGLRCNAELHPAVMRKACPLPDEAEQVLRRLHAVRPMTARTIDRIIKVARTIADLRGEEGIDAGHVVEAASFRMMEVDGAGASLPQSDAAAAAREVSQ